MSDDHLGLPWRVGRSVGRTIYALVGEDSEILIGVMDTPELAQEAVRAHNAELSQPTPTTMTEKWFGLRTPSATPASRRAEVIEEPPFRVCCGTRHYGVICPSGRVMCCICFDMFEQDALWVDDEGARWDICRQCGSEER